MTRRLNPFAAAPASMQSRLEFGQGIHKSGLKPGLMELVKIRASQINGCAFCLDMHTRDARKDGETEARIYLLDAWREAQLYNGSKRTALASTEAQARLSEAHPADDALEARAAQFTEEEIVTLILPIVAISGRNRASVGSRVPPARAARAAA